MFKLIFSILLSFSYCLILNITQEYLPNIILTYISLNSTSYIIAFMIAGSLCGALPAYIISRYKSYNFIATMILPTLFVGFNLYILF